ncbi:MAG: hypothetical protein ABI874_05720 [Chloroflexota bacterium]
MSTQPDYIRRMSARGVWRGGRVNDIVVRDFPVLRSDEPAHNEGTNTGPTPLELTLSALCA